MRFVHDFECNHPLMKPEEDPRPILMEPEELEEGCDYHEPKK